MNRPLVVMMLLASAATACASTSESVTSDPGDPSASAAPEAELDASQAPLDTAPTERLPVESPPAPTTAAEPAASTSTLSPATIETSTTTETPRTETPTTSPSIVPGACVDDLDVRARVALLVWPAIYADDWAGAIDTVRSNDVGGVLLMDQRGVGADDLRSRLAELEAASRHGLIVSTDEEGGDVQRLRSLATLASQRRVSQELDPAGAADLIADHGGIVRAVGVDMVLGPVIDVQPNVGTVPLQPSRFFDGDPQLVADYAAAYLEGWDRAGLLATLKHYPGHGAASGDTHITAGVTPSLDDLREFDLRPYRDLAMQAAAVDAAVMVGHLTVPGLTDGVPATRSPAAVEYLRNELGYGDALLITDALGMAAVGLPEPEAAVLALAAGIDVVLFTLTSQTDEVIDELEQAVIDGRIDEDHVDRAARHVMALLGRDGHTCDGNR